MTYKGDNRQTNIELMRIVVMMMIVGCHFATHGKFSFEQDAITIPRLWWHVLYLGGNFGTDVFVMISGYFLVSDKAMHPKFTKVALIWLQIFFYSILLFAIAFPLGYGDLSMKSILTGLLPVSFSGWWFASAYFVLYLLHPYINLALNAMSKKQYQGFLLMLIVMWSVLPTITTSNFQKSDLIELLLMYVIAGYIKIYGLCDDYSGKKWFIVWLLSCLLTLGSAIIIMVLGKNQSVIASHSTYFYSQTSPLTIVRAVAFFMMFSKLKIRKVKVINVISSTMFGVYLLHDNRVIRSFLWKDFFKNAMFQDSAMIIPYSIFAVCTVMVIGVLIELCRQYIIEKPIRKMLN